MTKEWTNRLQNSSNFVALVTAVLAGLAGRVRRGVFFLGRLQLNHAFRQTTTVARVFADGAPAWNSLLNSSNELDWSFATEGS